VEGGGIVSLDLIPADIRARYEIEERRHACAILASDFPAEFRDILDCLAQFELVRSEIIVGGGGKTRIANRFDDYLKGRGWAEKRTEIQLTVDGEPRRFETHKVDLWRNKVAVEVEWNNKDPFFSRDLNAFRLLHELDVMAAGAIITRSDELQKLFDSLGYDEKKHRIGSKYGAATTHWGKLMPRVEAGGGGTCPLLLIGIARACYRDDIPNRQVRWKE
jgi:hypothetical protein